MKHRLITVALALLALLLTSAGLVADELNHGSVSVQADAAHWWDIPYPDRYDAGSLGRPQDTLTVSGNALVDEAGETVVLRGVNIADPAKLAQQGRWDVGLFEAVDDWGANAVRLPVHPIGWRIRGASWYLDRIDEAVGWANALGLYLIIDWHSIGNLNSGMFQHPMYETSMTETRDFWRRIAFRYGDVPTVAVYELFNEPTNNFIGNGDGSLGRLDWPAWRETLEELTDIVQVYDPASVVLVGGLNWAYDLSGVREMPLRRDGIAYAVHPYPQKTRPGNDTREAWFDAWESDWGFLAERYPLIATEIGWVREDGHNAHVPVIDNSGAYGPNLVRFMLDRGISWTAWIFDADWSPTMISDWDFTPTEQGRFFRWVMRRAEEGHVSPAVIPAPRGVEYPWMSMQRWRDLHAGDMAVAQDGEVDVLFVGDSITEGWPRSLWEKHYAPLGAANFGIGGDMTDNLLWRLHNGATGNLAPQAVVLMIGTNNLGIRQDSPEQVAAGIEAVVSELLGSFDEAEIILLGLLPRNESADSEMRVSIVEVNRLISELGSRERVSFHDIGAAFLQADGSISTAIMADFLHPTEKGYAVFAEQLDPILESVLD
jgi:lysophospholipase L1-like esterase